MRNPCRIRGKILKLSTLVSLKARIVRNPDAVAATALQAARTQYVMLPGQDVAPGIVAVPAGHGPILGAEFNVAAGDLGTYADAGRLASAASSICPPRPASSAKAPIATTT
uniref:hypothetical protein n=1 Tax=Streptomyces mirabilis TaxID=68239 RepID=UPI0036F1BA4F